LVGLRGFGANFEFSGAKFEYFCAVLGNFGANFEYFCAVLGNFATSGVSFAYHNHLPW
jgi:hypothetical protein